MLQLVAQFPLLANLVLDPVHIGLVQDIALLKRRQYSLVSRHPGF